MKIHFYLIFYCLFLSSCWGGSILLDTENDTLTGTDSISEQTEGTSKKVDTTINTDSNINSDTYTDVETNTQETGTDSQENTDSSNDMDTATQTSYALLTKSDALVFYVNTPNDFKPTYFCYSLHDEKPDVKNLYSYMGCFLNSLVFDPEEIKLDNEVLTPFRGVKYLSVMVYSETPTEPPQSGVDYVGVFETPFTLVGGMGIVNAGTISPTLMP